MITLAPVCVRMYRLPVAANSANGRRGPNKQKAHRRPHSIAGAFFVPGISFYGGCVWETERSAGILLPRSANPHTAATLIRFAANRGSSSAKGATPMRTTLSINPSKSHAAAWKARALAALRANSSLSVRLRRYNEAMARARSLETVGGVQ